MNIPGVSAATNYAAVQSSRLTQLSSGSAAVKQEGTDFYPMQKNLITKSLCASDNNYTKEDAIMKQWNKQGSFKR